MKAIVLAAGKGKRLQSEQFNAPKVLREICGKSLISYVLKNIGFIPKVDTSLVVGYMKEKVIEAVGQKYNFVNQDEQLGTGHAVMMAEPAFKDYNGDVLVLYGDMPLFKAETYKGIIEKHIEMNADCTILTAFVNPPLDYGRIIRDKEGNIKDIIEQKDCNEEQVKITELNVGIYVFKSKFLFECLKLLKNNNSQKEYYLTDVPKIAIKKGLKVFSHTADDANEVYGVNTEEDLKFCENLLD